MWRGRQMERLTDRQMERWTDEQIDKQIGGITDRQFEHFIEGKKIRIALEKTQTSRNSYHWTKGP